MSIYICTICEQQKDSDFNCAELDGKEWRQNVWWHLKQLIRSYKIWRKNNNGIDFGTFHCWRVNLGWRERDKKIYK